MSESSLVCPRCASPATPGADRCAQCGASLDDPVAAATPPPPPPPPPSGGGFSSGPGASFVAAPVPAADPVSEAPPIGFDPPQDSTDPTEPTPTSPQPAPTPSGGKSSLLIVLGVALLGLALIVGFVLYGQSKDDDTASAGGGVTNDTVDPAIGQQYVAIVAPANDAAKYYLAACGCPDSYNTSGAIAALPVLIATKEKEAAALQDLSLTAPPAAADDIENLARLETAVVTTAKQITASSQSLPPGAPVTDLTLFKQLVVDLDTAAQAVEVVRIDLGVAPGQLLHPSTTTTATG